MARNSRVSWHLTEIVQQHGVRAEVIMADLSKERSSQQILQEVERRNLMIDLLVNSAGFAQNGAFEMLEP